MILILSNAEDPHVPFLTERLERLGAAFVRVDPEEFPACVELSFEPRADRPRGTLKVRGRTLALDRVRAVWWRRPGKPTPPDWIVESEQRANISELADDALTGLWESLECLWVPCRPSARARANLKLWQLGIARAVGFDTPDTVITNDPERLLEFYLAHRGDVITKPLSPFTTVGGRRNSSAARRLARRGFRRLGALRHEAVIGQNFIPKAYELRVTVVDGRVFVATIDSGSVARAGVDWRTAYERLTFTPHRLPRDVARRCARLTREMGLTFGAIDLIVTPEGRHVFLEINPTGQWGFMPGVSGEIADALAKLLARGQTSTGERA